MHTVIFVAYTKITVSQQHYFKVPMHAAHQVYIAPSGVFQYTNKSITPFKEVQVHPGVLSSYNLWEFYLNQHNDTPLGVRVT